MGIASQHLKASFNSTQERLIVGRCGDRVVAAERFNSTQERLIGWRRRSGRTQRAPFQLHSGAIDRIEEEETDAPHGRFNSTQERLIAV